MPGILDASEDEAAAERAEIRQSRVDAHLAAGGRVETRRPHYQDGRLVERVEVRNAHGPVSIEIRPHSGLMRETVRLLHW
jgi:hypothetical protein